MSNGTVIDRSAIDSIRDIGGNELLVKLIDLFIDYVGGRVAAAKTAMEKGDITAVQDAVHPVKSSAANLGAERVRELARTIEQLARQKSAEHIPARIAELESAFASARAELEKIRAESPL
jgi:HPt (histidine-containing phosphotransfer) domain-containing protein